jgi:hypothetical protein
LDFRFDWWTPVPDLAYFTLCRFCLLMPLFVFLMVLQVWTVGSGDGYLLGGTVPLQEGLFFVYKGLFGRARGGMFAGCWFRFLLAGLMAWSSFVSDLSFVPCCVCCFVSSCFVFLDQTWSVKASV